MTSQPVTPPADPVLDAETVRMHRLRYSSPSHRSYEVVGLCDSHEALRAALESVTANNKWTHGNLDFCIQEREGLRAALAASEHDRDCRVVDAHVYRTERDAAEAEVERLTKALERIADSVPNAGLLSSQPVGIAREALRAERGPE